MKSLSAEAFAKVNLSFDIVGRRDDGYHDIRSIMQAISLADDITVETDGAPGIFGGVKIKLGVDRGEGLPGADVPADAHNLAWRAAALMGDHFCPLGAKVMIRLRKRIPAAAGLAGGSADAAVVMLCLARLWETGADLGTLCGIGAKLGADIPFCMVSAAKNNPGLGFADDPMASSTALTEGIGEIITPLPSPGGSLLLVMPETSVPTASIYGLYDEMGGGEEAPAPDTDLLVKLLKERGASGFSAKSLKMFAENMVNVFEPITSSRYPAVGDAISSISEALAPDADRVMMSGSGPAVFAWSHKGDGAFPMDVPGLRGDRFQAQLLA